MQFRGAQDLGILLLDARRRRGWSQSRLASEVGVSRQWISMVENGKTSVEFDLVLRSLEALGYSLYVTSRPGSRNPSAPSPPMSNDRTVISGHTPPERTSLTQRGKSLKNWTSRHGRTDSDGA